MFREGMATRDSEAPMRTGFGLKRNDAPAMSIGIYFLTIAQEIAILAAGLSRHIAWCRCLPNIFRSHCFVAIQCLWNISAAILKTGFDGKRKSCHATLLAFSDSERTKANMLETDVAIKKSVKDCSRSEP